MECTCWQLANHLHCLLQQGVCHTYQRHNEAKMLGHLHACLAHEQWLVVYR